MLRVIRRRSFRALRGQLPMAGDKVLLLFDHHSQRVGANHWGQYINDPRRDQVGLFGICAGVEIFARSGSSFHDRAVMAADGMPDLDVRTEPLDDETYSRILLSGDLAITFKACARAEATLPIGEPISRNRLFEGIVNGRYPGGGWSDYRSQSELASIWTQGPSVPATGLALFALRRYKTFHATDEHSQAIAWLLERMPVESLRSLPTYQLALALLGIASTTHMTEETGALQSGLRRELTNRLRRPEALTFTPESHEYAAPEVRHPPRPQHGNEPPTGPVRDDPRAGAAETTEAADGGEPIGVAGSPSQPTVVDADPQAAGPQGAVEDFSYRYMFYLPAVMAAYALLTCSGPLRWRERVPVMNVVDRCASLLIESDRVVARGRQWPSTVDHLWIFRLLKAYEARPDSEVRPVPTRVIGTWTAAITVLSAVAAWAYGWKEAVGAVVIGLLTLVGGRIIGGRRN